MFMPLASMRLKLWKPMSSIAPSPPMTQSFLSFQPI